MLNPGSHIGPYEIIAPLGAGGMGQVYRARDARLDRDVAVKALPEGVSNDPERLARFEREAKILASLNHPNIGAIYGLEVVDGVPYLVLELIDGQTLLQRLARGPLAFDETLEIAAQTAAAIDAAHDRGIIHRDLKPGNIMITTGGTVKVLDFGLARGGLLASSASGPDLSASPTIAVSGTREGIILGTAPYMSPEQARGQAVDRRTDVWAFGCIVFECLAGRPAFSGETVSDIVARILEREPDLKGLHGSSPRLVELIRRCLTKDVSRRPRDIGDLRLEIQAMQHEISTGAPRRAAAPDRPSLAVLYFENLSSDSESDYFCAGITEDILTDLSKIKGLRVASRNAVSRYRGTTIDPARIGAELGVAAVLEGSVRRSGDRVRISAQLINAADGFHLWADRFDRKMDDVFQVQEEIAASIAEALRVTLSPAEAKKIAQDRPKDIQAYDLYLRGRAHYGKYQKEDLKKATELFEQAIAIDPDYALAWAGIADACAQMVAWEVADDPGPLMSRALDAARRAVALNPRLAEAHKSEALVCRYMNDLEGERRALARALEANPRYTPALINLGVHKFETGDIAGAERLFRRVLEYDPQECFALIWLLAVCHMTGRPSAALAFIERLLRATEIQMYTTGAMGTRAVIEMENGDLGAAERTIRQALSLGADPLNMKGPEALLHVLAGRPQEARRLIDEMGDRGGLSTGAIVYLARAATRLGAEDVALRYLGRSITGRLSATLARVNPDLHPLLDRPPLAPRRRDAVLVWPVEGGRLDASMLGLFREVKLESGMPEGSELSRPPSGS